MMDAPHQNPTRQRFAATVREARRLPERAKVVRLDDLRVPIHIALGRFEAATQEELNELSSDIAHELARREQPGAA